MEDFRWSLPDCRFLGDPIDLLTFNGLSENKIESVSFIEVKSGRARLNPHQKQVKEAVEDNRVRYKVFQIDGRRVSRIQKILYVCPDCGRIVRLSDLKIKSKAEVETTWLDYYEYRERLLANRREKFDAVSADLRKAATLEGRRQADEVFNKAIKQDFREMNFDPSDINQY